MMTEKTKIIAISGGSGSGKTTFARDLKDALGSGCSILYQDSYYIDQSEKFDKDGGAVNFDHPDALEFSLLAHHLGLLKKGQKIEVPIYDFATHTRKSDTVILNPCPYILVDGILILSQKELHPHFDLSIYVDTCEQVRFERRLRRDVEERGRTPQGVEDQFYAQVAPMHDLFVEPSKNYASRILSGEESFAQRIEELVEKLTCDNIYS